MLFRLLKLANNSVFGHFRTVPGRLSLSYTLFLRGELTARHLTVTALARMSSAENTTTGYVNINDINVDTNMWYFKSKYSIFSIVILPFVKKDAFQFKNVLSNFERILIIIEHFEQIAATLAQYNFTLI